MAACINREKLRSLKPFLDDYLPLSFKEYSLIEERPDRPGIFIGSGPFPMTALCFYLFNQAKQSGHFDKLSGLLDHEGSADHEEQAFELLCNLPFSSCHGSLSTCCLDSSLKATESAREMFRSLGLQDVFSCLHENALEHEDWAEYSFIHIAAMISPRMPVLRTILDSLNLVQASGRILVRYVDSKDLRTLLYEPLSLDEVENLFDSSLCIQNHFCLDAAQSDRLKTSLLVAEYATQECLR